MSRRCLNDWFDSARHWDADGIPPSAVSDTDTLLLGYLDGHSGDENLDIGQPNGAL